MNYPKIAQFKTVEAFQQRLAELEIDLPLDREVLTAGSGSPLAEAWQLGPHRVGNRWCIHPMEGWDANRDGSPSEHTFRRWKHFGLSGAKLIWGGEAAAVQPDGRANPNQLLATIENQGGLARLRDTLVEAHREAFGSVDGLVAGLQLTHSGRFCRPHDHQLEPRIAYHHPLLDAKFQIPPEDKDCVWTDDELERLIDSYVSAARVARDTGFDFVDVKACHGYLMHEFLSARTRPGSYGGDYEGRTRLLKTAIQRIQSEVAGLTVVVRLSVFDTPPFQSSREIGKPMPYETLLPYEHGFGTDRNNPFAWDLHEPIRLIRELGELGVASVNVTCGSPYYNPHMQRPAIFPPSDGYLPPEDPLAGVARQIHATRLCKQALPNIPLVGSGYTYLQDYLPHVAQAVVRQGWVDSVGLGRMVLAYPQLPADTLAGNPWRRKQVCRTFSDCTTAPRNGMISGCFPLDPYYKSLAEARRLAAIKNKNR